MSGRARLTYILHTSPRRRTESTRDSAGGVPQPAYVAHRGNAEDAFVLAALVEIFDNFAFNEALRDSRLDTRTRLMVQLAALIASQALREYHVMLGAALTVGVTPVGVKEIVYQAAPYVGMARVFDLIHATTDALTERGVALPLPGQATTTPETRAEKGLAIQKRIVGSDRVERLHTSAPAEQQHIQRFLSANCFGDYPTTSNVPPRE